MKTIKTAISIPADVEKAAKAAAKERDISFSAFVSAAIKAALSGAPIEAGTASSPSMSAEIADIKERLSLLESAGITNVLPEVIPDVKPELPIIETIEPEQGSDPVKTEEVIPEVKPAAKRPKRAKSPRTGKLPITDKMRDDMIEHFDKLNDLGLTDSDIAAAVKMDKTRMTVIRKPGTEERSLKNIEPEIYEALMAVQPITS